MLIKAAVTKTSNVLSTPCDEGVPVAALNAGSVVDVLDTELGWSLIQWSQSSSDPIVGWSRNENLHVCSVGGGVNWNVIFATGAIVVIILLLTFNKGIA